MLNPTTIQIAPAVCLRLQCMFSPCPTRRCPTGRLPVWPKKVGLAQSLLYIFPTSAASSQVRQKTAERLYVIQNDLYDDP